jgi:hypothetical protein
MAAWRADVGILGLGRCLIRRALDLVYALVNEGNIESLTKELLEYLAVADAEFKPDLTAKIAALVQRFAPNKRWHFDSLLQACALAPLRMPPALYSCSILAAACRTCCMLSGGELWSAWNAAKLYGMCTRRRCSFGPLLVSPEVA